MTVPFETLKEAKEYLRANFNVGVKCPCCGQRVQLYRKNISATMAMNLINLYRCARASGVENFYHVSQFHKQRAGSGGGDFAKLRYWELIEEMENDEEKPKKKRTSGFWRITPKGIAFVSGQQVVQKYAQVYNMKVRGFEGAWVTIDECLSEKFNFSELMGFEDESPTY